MKKNIGYFIVIIFLIATVVLTYYNYGMENIVLVSAGFLVLLFFILFEMKSLDARKIAAVSTLSALGGVLRVPFAAIPGLQPTTFITAVAGYTLGPVNGFMVGTMSAFISNFFLSHGPWTLWQMLGWGLCGFFFGLLRNINSKINIWAFALLCGVWGYLYGIILDMWYIVAFIKPLNINAVLVGFGASFYFDTVHSIGNVLFTLMLGKKFIKTLDRFNKRYTVEYINYSRYLKES